MCTPCKSVYLRAVIENRGALENRGLVDVRQAWLLETVATDRRVATGVAAAHFDVSVDTIRRDLRQLHDRGLLRRVHGGAVPIARLPNSFAGRTAEPSQATAVLAAEVIERLKPGQIVGLDGGTTCVDIAAMIPSSLPITIVTNSPAAAVALTGHPTVKVILLGGQVDLTWMTTTGADTVDAWRNYQLDIGVLGVCGLDAETGVTTNSPLEVATKRALIASSTDVIVAVSQDKVGVRAPYVVAGLDALDIVVTETALPDDLGRACQARGSEVVVACNPTNPTS